MPFSQFEATEKLGLSRWTCMRRMPKYPQLKNVVFLDKIGDTLRQATSDIAREDLPDDIQRLLRRLERVELREQRKAKNG